ncbi:MAG: phosphoglycerate dehydrogenase [Pseudomonadota bacterium]
MKVLVADNLAQCGIDVLQRTPGIECVVKKGLSPDELKVAVADAEGLVIRSATRVTADIIEAAPRLRVIGRAGIGLDNVDVSAASKRGIVVMNVPEGNVVTTAEHAISMLLALSRNIPQATASLKAGRWEKSRFKGREIFNKTLGIVGIGRIGKIVADRALGLKMRVISYDPYISPESVERVGDVEMVSFDEMLARSDYISLHVPKTPDTTNLLNAAAFAKMKPGVMVINCARGGIIDEEALLAALRSGKVAGAAIDVFAKEPPDGNPLLEIDGLICTPHLGASTNEAQDNVSRGVAEQVAAYLTEGTVCNAVNVPSLSADVLSRMQPLLTLAEKMGSFHSQMAKGALKQVSIEYLGEVSEIDCTPLTTAVLKGLLTPVLRDAVNFVNAPFLAKDRGIKVIEAKSATATDYTSLLVVRAVTSSEENVLAGTIFGRGEPRVVRINSFGLEAAPEGHLLLIQNDDNPGVIGGIGTTLGRHNLNISRMHVGQAPDKGRNIVLLNTDTPVSDAAFEELRGLTSVVSALRLEL